MSFSKPNRSPATKTKNRVEPAPVSGICVTCLDGCPGPCEIGQSAIKGREVIYPQPYGKITAGADKDYPVDFSHFNIQGTVCRRNRRGAGSRQGHVSRSGLQIPVGSETETLISPSPCSREPWAPRTIARANWKRWP